MAQNLGSDLVLYLPDSGSDTAEVVGDKIYDGFDLLAIETEIKDSMGAIGVNIEDADNNLPEESFYIRESLADWRL